MTCKSNTKAIKQSLKERKNKHAQNTQFLKKRFLLMLLSAPSHGG